MKGISRRARACAVVAATGVAVLAGAGDRAGAARPAKTGDGVPTGQGASQMFNYGGYISQRRRQHGTAADPGHRRRRALTARACATADRRRECRWNRLDALFAFLPAQGRHSIELFGHAGFPANERHRGPGWPTARCWTSTACTPRGWHGTVSEVQPGPTRVAAAKILGADYIGSGGVPTPGIGSYDDTLPHRRDAQPARQVLGRERRRPRLHPQPHSRSSDTSYVDNGVLKTAWQIFMERIDARYVARRDRRLLGLGRVRRRHRHRRSRR